MGFSKFKERSEVVTKKIADNKVFAVGAAIILIFLVFQAVKNKDVPDAIELQYSEEYVQQADQSGDSEKVATSSNFSEQPQAAPEESHWRFYWSDLAVLGIGSAFCGIVIIRERRKARENL